MCQLIETIKIFNGKLYNINFHNDRFNKSRNIIFNINDCCYLQDLIKLPFQFIDGLIKCRILYSKEIEKIDFENYNKPSINTLKIVHDNEITYSFKFKDRKAIESLKSLKENCDDIIIVKNKKITDSSFCNIVLFDGIKYFTPDTPLLEGTKRKQLIQEGIIYVEEISVDDLKLFKEVFLINSMNNLGDIKIKIENIR